MPISKRATAEFVGTFWLVFGGCGSAVLAAGFPELGIGFVGVALAFGLTRLPIDLLCIQGWTFLETLAHRSWRQPEAWSCLPAKSAVSW